MSSSEHLQSSSFWPVEFFPVTPFSTTTVIDVGSDSHCLLSVIFSVYTVVCLGLATGFEQSTQDKPSEGLHWYFIPSPVIIGFKIGLSPFLIVKMLLSNFTLDFW